MPKIELTGRRRPGVIILPALLGGLWLASACQAGGAEPARRGGKPAASPQTGKLQWGQPVNNVSVNLSSPRPTILYPWRTGVRLHVDNHSGETVKFNSSLPYDPKRRSWAPQGWLEVVDSSGRPVLPRREGWKNSDGRLGPGKSFKGDLLNGYDMAFPGAGKYRARIAIRMEPAGGKPFTVGSDWLELNVQLTSHQPGTPLTAYDELVLARAGAGYLLSLGKITYKKVVQQFLDVAKKYPGTKYALEAYKGAGLAAERESLRERISQEGRSKPKDRTMEIRCYKQILRQWPEVVSDATIHARVQLAYWSGKLEEKMAYYRWLMTRTEQHKLDSIRNWWVRPPGWTLTAAEERRILRSLDGNIAGMLRAAERGMVSPLPRAADLRKIIEVLPETPVCQAAETELKKRSEADRTAEPDARRLVEQIFAAAAAGRRKFSSPLGTYGMYDEILEYGRTRGVDWSKLRVGEVYASKEDAVALSRPPKEKWALVIGLSRRSGKWRGRLLRIGRMGEREKIVREFLELHPKAKEVPQAPPAPPTTGPAGRADRPAMRRTPAGSGSAFRPRLKTVTSCPAAAPALTHS